MQVRTVKTEDEVNSAIAVDESATGTRNRADYIIAVAKRDGLTVAFERGKAVGFCCVDDRYFFEKPFVSLLIVDGDVRQMGFGSALLQSVAVNRTELWTSTNRSNSAMRGLLEKAGWHYCGELDGLDVGDPELFFKRSN